MGGMNNPPNNWLRHQLGKNVRQVRLARSLSQEELGGRLGVSKYRVSEIERARFSITVDSIQRVAAALGVEPMILFDGRLKFTANDPN
jgi:transcriptional regulator with XRE-family HTH domain